MNPGYVYTGTHLLKRPRVTFALVHTKNPRISKGYLTLKQAVDAAKSMRTLGILGGVIYEIRPIYRVKTIRRGNKVFREFIPVGGGL